MKFSEFPYKRFDMAEVKKQFDSLIESSRKALSGEEQFEIHKKYYELISDIVTTIRIGNFRHDIDTKDEFYAKEKEYLDAQLPLVEQLENEYKKVLYNSPYRDYLEEKIGKVAFKNIELANKSISDEILLIS